MKLMQVADALPGKIASRLKTIWQVAPVGTTARLRLLFLAPLAAVIVAIIGLLVYAFYAHMYEEIHHEVGRVQVALGKMYKNDLAHDVGMLRVAMEVFHHDSALREALARQDRARLLVLTAPVFTKLREQQGITHFYFSGPDRVNLLRVHQPNRYGDAINRYTTLEAERTGAMAHGVELGPLGTFTLRLVSPWYADAERHRLLGYVELGMEIDHILQGMQPYLDTPVFALISKAFLRRDDWEAGMKMLGRMAEWERFPDAVLSAQAAQAMPPPLPRRWLGRRHRARCSRRYTDPRTIVWLRRCCTTRPAASSARWWP